MQKNVIAKLYEKNAKKKERNRLKEKFQKKEKEPGGREPPSMP